ncbi:MAG: hypothetical protein C0597_00280 [Marinilabiliales bacterium]|nr:MAG: hypothetical protein C0597_00280 [Marinilabiliales bacterium]
MHTNKIIVIVFLILGFSKFNLKAQQSNEFSYGQNSILYNGELYNYSISNRVKGHQYFKIRDFKEGSITIKNKRFERVLLNYDIHKQQILLKFMFNGVDKIISIPKEIVKEFSFNNNYFMVLNQGWDFKIYEVIGSGEVKILRYWEKDFKISSGSEASDYIFTNATKTNFLLKDKQLVRLQSKRIFLKQFQESNQPKISKFMRTNRIYLKKAMYSDLNELIKFCNSLEN